MADEQNTAPINIGPASIIRAFKPGDVVFIEMTEHHPAHTLKAFAERIGDVSQHCGVKIVLLTHGMKVSGAKIEPEAQS